MGHSPRPLGALLDVFQPGLASRHLLVCRRKCDRSSPLVGAFPGGIAFVARVVAIVVCRVQPLDRSGMHVAAPDRPARQRHRESRGVQPKTCCDHLPDAGVANAAPKFVAPSRCSLSRFATCHGAQHLLSPHGGMSSQPRGSRSFSSSSAPRRGRASVVSGSGLKSCPQRQLATK